MNAPINLHIQLEWTRACSRGFASYLESHPVQKLQLGAGSNVLDGWFNTDIAPVPPDIFFLDSTKRFPFADATFDYVFSEHHLEHLNYQAGLATLRESYRVLRPGGKIRIATPNLEVLLGLYTVTPDKRQQRYIQFITETFLPHESTRYNPVFVINNAFHNWGHQFLYDCATLRQTLEEVGFVPLPPVAPGDSSDEHLRGIERHGCFVGDEEINRFETMVLEGQRPL